MEKGRKRRESEEEEEARRRGTGGLSILRTVVKVRHV